jgi:adenylyltransferase/sulfurtransferase
MMLSDNDLLKYSRQIMLPQLDIDGQQKLLNSQVLVIGLGGLGAPVALYLAGAGVQRLILVDDDKVEISNLHRQVIHRNQSQGESKVNSAKCRLNELNPDGEVVTYEQRLNEKELLPLIEQSDVVADCSDNFETRFLLNRLCNKLQTPLVSGAAIRWEGQLTTFTMQPDTPCYRCLYDEISATDQSCSSNGIMGPVVGIIGSMQALEVIKLITGCGKPHVGQLTLFDGLDLSFNKLMFSPVKDCPVCSK